MGNSGKGLGRKVWALALGVWLAGMASSEGEKIRFPIALTATVQTATNSVRVTDVTLVSAVGNRLVLAIDLEAGVVAIEEWNATLTQQVDRDAVLSGTQGLLENFRMAALLGRSPQLQANLEMVDMDWDHDGVADADGNMQLIARLTLDRVTRAITRVNAQLLGVFNDPVNGMGGGEAKVLRGTLRTTGPAF